MILDEKTLLHLVAIWFLEGKNHDFSCFLTFFVFIGFF